VTNGGLSSSVDLAPTLLEYAGLPINNLPGANLRTRSDDDPVFSGTIERAVLYDRFKGIFGGPRDLREVFDLSADPGELDDLAARDRQRMEMLRELLRRQRRQSADLHRLVGSETRRHEIVLSEHERERLKAFGYLQ